MLSHSNLLVVRALSTLALASLILTAISAETRAEKSEDEMTVYTEEQAVTGRDLYAEHCAFCHGMMLEGRSSVPLSGRHFPGAVG